MKQRTSPIRSRLITLVLSVTIPVAIAIGLLLSNNYREGRNQLETSTIATARALATALDQRLEGVQSTLAVLATSRLLWSDDLSQFREQAIDVKALQNLEIIGLIDAELQPALNTVNPYGSNLRPGAVTPYIKSVFTTGKPVISGLFKGTVITAPLFAVGVPVLRNGAVTHALVAGMSPDSISQLIHRQKMPDGWLVTVLDRSGKVVARNRDQDKFVGRQASQRLLTRISLVSEEASEGVSLDGDRIFTAFSTAPVSQWTVAIGIPYDELTDTLRKTIFMLVTGILVFLTVGIGLAWSLGEKIVSSVQALKLAAAQMGRREPLKISTSNFAEANDLAQALEQASYDLQRADDEIVASKAQLQQASSRLGGLVDSTLDAIISIDQDHLVVLFNRAAEDMFGYARGDVLGRSIAILMPARFQHGYEAYVQRFMTADVTARRLGSEKTLCGLRASGQEFPIEASISQVAIPEGKLFTVILRDVSERQRARDDLAAFLSKSSALREQEKKKVARELHDDVAQTMAVLKIDLLSLGASMPSMTQAISIKIVRMISLLDAGVTSTRRIAADLRPLMLDDLGLSAALEWLVESFVERTGVECELDISNGFYLLEPQATEVFRIVQEALTNVSKHAEATQVFVQLQLKKDVLNLRVQDNGHGFQPTVPHGPLALGLAGLRERVGLLKGTMNITSALGRGTTLKVQIPFEGAIS